MRILLQVRPWGEGAPWLFGLMWVNGMLNIGLGVATIIVVPA